MKYRRGGTSYSTAVGRVRAKEKLLFNKAYLLSLAEAKDVEEIIEMLSKTNYAKYIAKMPGEVDYKEIIRNKWGSVRNLYRKIIFDKDINSFLWNRYDLSNAKILLKARYLNIEPDELSKIGNVDLGKLKEYILNDKKVTVPIWIADGVASARKKFEASNDPKDISLALDKAYFSFLKNIIGRKGNSFLRDLLIIEIDIYNLKAFLRIKAQNGGNKFLDEVLVKGGRRRKDFYVNLLEASFDEVINAYQNSPYGDLIKEGIQLYMEGKSFWKIEKLVDDHLLSFVKQIKHAVFGFEPLIGYIFARRNEAKALRLIIEGKLSGVGVPFIKERIPEVYV